MLTRIKKLAALALALLLLAGCAGPSLLEHSQELKEQRATEAAAHSITNEDLEYRRPDLDQILALAREAADLAQTGTVREIMDAVYAFYDAYDWFYTCYSLADLRYSADLTDSYWEEEYSFCMDSSPAVDAAMEEMYYALAQSPHREKLEKPQFFGEGFFDGYEGDNLWDDAFTGLLEQESALQAQYYVLSEEALAYAPGSAKLYMACADDMAQVLVELIRVRQQMAEYWGYESYAQFAWDFYYYRDYTPEQAMTYYADISRELVPIYRRVADSDAWDGLYVPVTEEQTYEYVRTAAMGMGGMAWEAFQFMEAGRFYDIAYGENKYASSFETYLTSYGVPYVFMCPEQWAYDCLTFAHEFGHFCNDYASHGSVVGIDVAEVFSQGTEYMSLCYGGASEALVRGKLADSLATYVEQAAFACFEQRMYELKGDALSVEGLYALYDQVAQEFGFDAVGYDRREFVEITHFFTNPMYVVSYVVSNDAAMQFYQLELEQQGTGVALLEENWDTEQSWFLAFLEEAGLESPFAPGRIESVRNTFEAGLA